MITTIEDLFRDIDRGREITDAELENFSDKEIVNLLVIRDNLINKINMIENIAGDFGYIVPDKVLNTSKIDLINYLIKDIEFEITNFHDSAKNKIENPESEDKLYLENHNKYVAYYREAEKIFLKMKRMLVAVKTLEEKFLELESYYDNLNTVKLD